MTISTPSELNLDEPPLGDLAGHALDLELRMRSYKKLRAIANDVRAIRRVVLESLAEPANET